MFNWMQLIGLSPITDKTTSTTEIMDRLFHWLLRAEKLNQHETEVYYKMEEVFDRLHLK